MYIVIYVKLDLNFPNFVHNLKCLIYTVWAVNKSSCLFNDLLFLLKHSSRSLKRLHVNFMFFFCIIFCYLQMLYNNNYCHAVNVIIESYQ